MEINSVMSEETSFLQGGGVRSYRNGKYVHAGRIVYRSDSVQNFMQNFTRYNEDDYIAFVGLELAKNWAANMQVVRMFSSESLSKESIYNCLEAAKVTIAPYHAEEENVKMAKEILIAHWAYGKEFAKADGFDEQDVERIQAKADMQAILHKNYEDALESEEIEFSTPLMEKYWNFKSSNCDVADKDCCALAGDWIKAAQLFMKAENSKELTEDILYESALQVREHNPLAKTTYDGNVLKIRDDYYNRVVQVMICCWKQGEEVGKIHSTDNTSIAKIRKFPVKDRSFKNYMRGRGSVVWQYAIEKLYSKIYE